MTNTGESQMADKEVVSAVPPLSCPRNKAGRALRFLSKRPHSTEDRQVRSTAQETPPDLRSHHTVTNTPAVSTHSPTTFRYTAQHPGLPSFDPSNPSSPTPRLSTPVCSLCPPAAPVYNITSPRHAEERNKAFHPAHLTRPPPAPPGCRRRLS